MWSSTDRLRPAFSAGEPSVTALTDAIIHAAMQSQASSERQPQLSWEVDVPLLSNPRYLRAVLLIAGLSGLGLPLLLIGPLLLIQGDGRALLSLAQLFVILTLVFLLLMLIAMAVIFGNRLRFRFTIDSHGIVQETPDRRSWMINRLTTLAGLWLASPSTAGAGLLAQAQERQTLAWSGAFRLEARPFPAGWRRAPFVFSNRWRPLLEVYATGVNRHQVAGLIQHYMALHRPDLRLAPGGALLPALFQTLAVLLACLLVGMTGQEQPSDALLTMLLLAFALATVWMLPPFALVVLLLCGVILALSLAAFSTAPSHSGDRILMLGLQGLGLSYLGWFSQRVLRGRWLPMLLRDDTDRGA